MPERGSRPTRQTPSPRPPSSSPSSRIELQTEEVYEELRIIQTLTLVALGTDNEELSAEVLAILQQRTLSRILVVTEKALAKAPRLLEPIRSPNG
jgi:hypothetical protein